MQSFFAALAAFWLSILGNPGAEAFPATPTSAPVVEVSPAPTIIETEPSEPIVLGASAPLPAVLGTTDDMVTRTEFNAAIAALRSELFAVTASGHTSPLWAGATSVSLDFFKLQIDRAYDSVSRSVSGAKDSVTDNLTETIDATVAAYLPLSGGTLTGALTGTDLTLSGTLTANALSVAALSLGSALEVSYLNATSTSATSTFAGGLTAGDLTVDRATGYVGVGTTTPAFPFSVLGNAYIKGDLQINGNTSISEDGELTVGDKIISSGEIGVGSTTPWAKLAVRQTGTDGAPAFAVEDEADDATPFVITEAGNVGIGTAAPSSLFHVAGASTALSSTIGGQVQITTDRNNLAQLSLVDAAGGDTWAIGTGISAANSLDFRDTTASGGPIRMTLDGSGNVGIGTTSPYAKLSVVGPVVAEYFHATSSAATSTFSGGLTTGSSGLNVLTNGNVGIGTTDPSQKLDVSGAVVANATFAARSGTIASLASFTGLAFGYDNSQDRGFFFSGTTNSGGSVTGRKPAIFDYSTFTFTRNGGSTADIAINSSGNVGIGTASPGAPLEILKTASGVTSHLLLTNRQTPAADVGWQVAWLGGTAGDVTAGAVKTAWEGAASTDSYLSLWTRGSNSITEKVRISSTGNVGIGTTNPGQKLTVAGTVGFPAIANDAGTAYVCITLATGVISTSTSACNPSSLRFKDNVQDLSYGLDDLLSLHPVSFTYKPELLVGGNQVGFIAEELADVLPEAVGYDKNGLPYNVDYGKVTPLLVRAVQELWAFVTERFAAQDDRIETLEAEVAELRALIGAPTASDAEDAEENTDDEAAEAVGVDEGASQSPTDDDTATTTPTELTNSPPPLAPEEPTSADEPSGPEAEEAPAPTEPVEATAEPEESPPETELPASAETEPTPAAQ